MTAATRATYIAFAVNGFSFASWASRIPAVKDRLDLSPQELGLVLIAIAIGSVLALPASGPIVHRFGTRRVVAAMGVVGGASLVVVAVGQLAGVLPLVIGLFIWGLSTAVWDVAMNIQGALVEQHLGRSIMSRFHAGWSIGTVAGALLGTLMVALGVPVAIHLGVIGVAVLIGMPRAVRAYLPDEPTEDTRASSALRAWKEPRTLLVGLFTLAFAFGEGAANDWIGVAMIDDRGVDHAVGTLALATFLVAMTTGRWVGPGILDRFGRVPTLRVMTVVALIGLATFIFVDSVPLAFAGVVLWGLGIALGFPVGMSAGADDPAMAAPRVAVISSIGYCAFLGGPPLIGFIGEQDTVLHALIAVMVTLVIATAVTSSIKPLTPGARR
jgi:predicted MFS family arabinose efflux permease